MLKKFWKESVAVIKEKDPAFKSAIEVLPYPQLLGSGKPSHCAQPV